MRLDTIRSWKCRQRYIAKEEKDDDDDNDNDDDEDKNDDNDGESSKRKSRSDTADGTLSIDTDDRWLWPLEMGYGFVKYAFM